MSTVNIGIENTARKEISDILEVFLASEVVLNMKIRNYHWNVTAMNFSELHSFFEELYEQTTESIDEIAERIRMLWYEVSANYSNFLQKSFIDEETQLWLSSTDMIQNLLSDKEATIQELRDAVNKVGELWDVWNEDFLTAAIQAHEKNAWMLRSTLQK